MARGSAYLYYLPAVDGGVVLKNVHIYDRWVSMARAEGLDVRMVTFVGLSDYLEQYERLVERDLPEYLDVVIVPHPKVRNLYQTAYFLLQGVLNDRVIVHARKVETESLDTAKKFLGDALCYVVDIEGDIVAEAEYLQATDPERTDADVDSVIERKRAEQRSRLSSADHLIAPTTTMIDRFDQRYHDIEVAERATALPLGFPEAFEFDPSVREAVRADLGVIDRFVCCYLGSAHYNWQNIPRTLETVAEIRARDDLDPIMLILVPEHDHATVREYVERVGLDDRDYLLREVPHDEVPRYLNAADLGFALRDRHPMNEVTYPGKFLEYVATGLPTVTTAVVTDALDVEGSPFGIVLDDVRPASEIASALAPILHGDGPERETVEAWAREEFSTAELAPVYAGLLRDLAGGGRAAGSEHGPHPNT